MRKNALYIEIDNEKSQNNHFQSSDMNEMRKQLKNAQEKTQYDQLLTRKTPRGSLSNNTQNATTSH